MNKKLGRMGDLSWHLLLNYDHNDTLPTGLGPVGAGGLNEE